MIKFYKTVQVGNTMSEIAGKDNPVVAISITTIDNNML